MTSLEYFLDSSAIYSFVDKNDKDGSLVESLLTGHRLSVVTTNFIFAESISLMTKRLGKRVAETSGDLLQDSNFVRLVYLDEKIQREAWTLFKKYKDKDFDFIDATSFVFCQKYGIKKAITLDSHFKQMGFEIVP